MIEQLAVLAILATGVYYLAARAEVTQPLWSRYHGRLDRLARCPACSGFWIGLGEGVLVALQRTTSLARGVLLTAGVGLAMMVLVPIVFAVMKLALDVTAIRDEESDKESDE